jgi:DNA-binding MarR family transcriptional regulator
LQRTILQWLASDARSRYGADETSGVPYGDIVRALTADKSSVTATLRQLLRKGLVVITIPPGGWTRCVFLTERGRASITALAKAAPKRRFRLFADESSEFEPSEGRWRVSFRRRDRQREARYAYEDENPPKKPRRRR